MLQTQTKPALYWLTQTWKPNAVSGVALLISIRRFLQTVPRKKTSILLHHPSIISSFLLFTLIGLSLPIRLLSFWLPGSLAHGKHLWLSALKLSMLVRDIPWLGDSGVSRQLFQTAWRLWKRERNSAFILCFYYYYTFFTCVLTVTFHECILAVDLQLSMSVVYFTRRFGIITVCMEAHFRH